MWPNESQELMVGCEHGDMLQNKCDSCCAEEAEFGTRIQMRLLRMVRLIVGILMVLLGLVLVLLGVLIATPVLFHKDQCKKLNTGNPLEAVSEKQYLRPVSRPSAFLTVPREKNLTDDFLEWDCSRCQGGFIYSEGNLTVPAKGLYRVYLQVTFMYEKNKDDECRSTQDLTISVKHFSNNYPTFVPLLTSEDTMSCKEGWTKSMYTSGTFELDAGSKLRVLSFPAKLIHRLESQVFFGADLQPI